jgi:antitoxin FitA
MAAITVRNLSAETHRALKVRAARNERSTEAEVRAILDASVRPTVRLGTALRMAAGGGADLNLERDRRPVDRASFT